MTREQKIEWLSKATNEEVLDQLRWTVTAMSLTGNTIEQQMNIQEDYELVTAEIMGRMAKA